MEIPKKVKEEAKRQGFEENNLILQHPKGQEYDK